MNIYKGQYNLQTFFSFAGKFEWKLITLVRECSADSGEFDWDCSDKIILPSECFTQLHEEVERGEILMFRLESEQGSN